MSNIQEYGNNQALTQGQSDKSLTAIEQSRAIQEVQASLIIAQKMPRDQLAAEQRILQACKRKSLAETAMYAYPRGGQTVSGPSIRLAEVLAQNWGNLSYGVREVEREGDKSIMQAYCWDMETNTKREMTFQVKHYRDKRSGKVKLSDERDIYEMVANQGARRVRACILGVIPPDVVEAAVEQINDTLAGGSQEPIKDRVRKMLRAFEKYSVVQNMLESKLGHELATVSEDELAELRSIFNSIKDGITKREDWFAVAKVQQSRVSVSEMAEAAKQAQGKEPNRQTKVDSSPVTEKPAPAKAQVEKSEAPACVACEGSGKNSKGGTCKPCGGSGMQKAQEGAPRSFDEIMADGVVLSDEQDYSDAF